MGSKKPKHVAGGAISGLARKAVPAGAAKPPTGFVSSRSGDLVVRWIKFDYDGPWCIGRSAPEVIVELMKRLRDIEKMTPPEVFAPGPNPIGVEYGPPACLPNSEAAERLRVLGLDDETSISRLRISGARRLYGVRRDPEFYAIFWDPDHVIWPSKLKHT